jgi:hypothetical protein
MYEQSEHFKFFDRFGEAESLVHLAKGYVNVSGNLG